MTLERHGDPQDLPDTTGSAGPRTRTRRPFRAPLGIIATLLCVALAVGFAVGRAGDTPGAPALTPYQNIADNMSRTDLSGLGSAPVGGQWVLQPQRAASVTPAGAVLRVGPNGTVRATVSGVQAADEMVRTTFEVPAARPAGHGLYFGLELRRQSDGAAYRAQLNFRPDGQMVLRLVKRVRGVPTVLARSAAFATPAAGTPLTLEAVSVGSTPTRLAVRWWPSTAARPAWQLSTVDAKPGALAHAGRFGVMAFQDPAATAAAITVRQFAGWKAVAGTSSAAPSSSAPIAGGPATLPGSPSSSVKGSASSAPAKGPAAANSSSATSAPAGSSGGTQNATASSPPPATASTVGNTSASAVGSLAPGLTSYAVPSGAVFVSKSGSASGNGTSAHPVSTIAQAIRLAHSGGTIVIRAGVYHEAVTTPANKTLTIQAYPHEAVWMDGSSTVTGWTKSGSGWVHTNWTARFDHSPNYVTSGAIQSKYPMAAYPDQLWINGSAQRQVGSLSQLGAGTFYVDTANKRLYVGSSPSGATVKASDLQVALYLGGPNSAVRGIGVRNYATSVAQKGTVRLRGDGSSIQNVIILNSATCGLDVNSHNLRVDHVSVINAGLMGAHGGMSDGLQFTNSVLQGNNSQHFLYKPVAGGIKLGSSRNVRFVHNLVAGNDGIGVWFDVSSMNITIASNTITGNTLRGIQTEISQNAIVVDNKITNNGQVGVFVLDTGGVKIWNNTFSGQGQRDITILQDSRTPQNYRMGWDQHTNSPNPSIPWVTRNIQISNNLVQSTATQYEMSVYDASQKRSASGMGVTVDGNVYSRPSGRGHYEIGWAVAHKGIPGYATTTAFTKATGQGHNNRDYLATQMSAASAASSVGSPLPMPSDVAAAAGRATGTRHVGAF